MPKNDLNVTLKGIDELLFSTEEQRQEEKREQVQQIPIDELHPFTNHPFKVVDDDAMTRTVESIAQFGVLAPLIARPRPDGDGYEIISGHRRQYAARLAGLETLPVIVRDMDDDAATILMVDSNLQREHISPSERAFAYKMKMDAMKRTAGRPPKENPRQVVGNFETADLIGKESGESGRQVQRFIRLTNLIPELLDLRSEKAKAEQQLRYYKYREKILEHQIPELTRKARVHRLCTRAGMLESFLIAPEELTNDQVMELLKISFRQPEVVLALAKMVHDVHERSNVQNPLE